MGRVLATPTPLGTTYPAGSDRPIPSMGRFIMATIVAKYEADPTAEPLPKRQIITMGTVAVDVPLLAVMYGGIHAGTPGNDLPRAWRNNDPRAAVWNIELWRAFPALSAQATPPTPQVEQAAAEILMQDSWLLMESAYDCDQMGVGVVATAALNDPQGETAGVTMRLELQVI